jgi:hypothetical protein
VVVEVEEEEELHSQTDIADLSVSGRVGREDWLIAGASWAMWLLISKLDEWYMSAMIER